MWLAGPGTSSADTGSWADEKVQRDQVRSLAGEEGRVPEFHQTVSRSVVFKAVVGGLVGSVGFVGCVDLWALWICDEILLFN